MHPLAVKLANQWIGDFWAANHAIRWTAAEQEHSKWLSSNTLLVGRVDGQGVTADGDSFFLENKTASSAKARRMPEEKVKWRTNPQALTYGVLLGDETRRFTVRWAIKPTTTRGIEGAASTDFEWYEYTTAEVDHWRQQLLELAEEIRGRRPQGAPWLTNRSNCYRYGLAYACPFLESCHALDFNRDMQAPRVPHLEIERQLKVGHNVVVLDASRTEDYLECPESYRRKWEGAGFQEESEALTIGKDFHSLVAAHINEIRTKGEHDRT